MLKTAEAATPVHPLVAERWSPRAFDPAALDDDAVRSMLEAARWAPSAMNHQPWRFVVGRHGDVAHKILAESLVEANRVWAGHAPLLLLAVARSHEEDDRPRPTGSYELGLAVAQLVLQAEALGLHAHQMGGFDHGRVAADLGVPRRWQPVVTIAVGRAADPQSLPEPLRSRELAPRARLPLTDLAFGETWGEAAAVGV